MAFNPQLNSKPGHRNHFQSSLLTFNIYFVFILLSTIISIRTILHLSADITQCDCRVFLSGAAMY